MTAILSAFREGASIATLAALLDRAPLAVEDSIRAAVREMEDETRQPAPLPADAPAKARTKPAPQPPPAARVPKPFDAALSGYPEALRDPRAVGQRAIYDVLRQGPKTIGEIEHATGMSNANACSTTYALRRKNLARGSEDTPVVWLLVA